MRRLGFLLLVFGLSHFAYGADNVTFENAVIEAAKNCGSSVVSISSTASEKAGPDFSLTCRLKVLAEIVLPLF